MSEGPKVKRAVLIRAVPYALVIAVLVACQAPVAENPAMEGAPTVTLTGTITSAGGHELVLSHAHLHDMASMTHSESVRVGADGSFTLEIPTDRFFELRATAVDHEMAEIPLILDGESQVEIHVALEPTEFVEELEEVRIAGPWGEEGEEETITLEKLGDGTYRRVVEGLEGHDQMRYQVLGVTADKRAVNGTASDGFEYDGGGDYYSSGGDYYSVVNVTEGRAEITFEPAALPTPVEGPEISTASAAIRGAIELVREVRESADEFRLLSLAAKESGERLEQLDQDRVELMANAVDIALALTDDELAPAALRSYAAASFLSLAADCPDDVRERALAHLPVDSIYWVVAPDFASSLEVEKDADLILALRAENPSSLVRGSALVRLIEAAKEADNEEEWNRLYDELQEEYGDVRGLAYPLAELNPDKPVKIGRPVPEFKVTLLDGREVSKESFESSYVLLDFWATWCAPCIAEMPKIEKTWAVHKGDDFQILSLSFDESLEDIQPFRDEKYAMPWLHAFVEGGFTSELAQAFGVHTIPELILVDPDGVVVATDATLRGEELQTTITAHLEGRADEVAEASSGP